VAAPRAAGVGTVRRDLLRVVRVAGRAGADEPPLRAGVRGGRFARARGLRAGRLLRREPGRRADVPGPVPGPAGADRGRDGPGARRAAGGRAGHGGGERARFHREGDRGRVQGRDEAGVPGGGPVPRGCVPPVPLQALSAREAGVRAGAAGGRVRRRPGQLHVPALRPGHLVRPGVPPGQHHAGEHAGLPGVEPRGRGRGRRRVRQRQSRQHEPAAHGVAAHVQAALRRPVHHRHAAVVPGFPGLRGGAGPGGGPAGARAAGRVRERAEVIPGGAGRVAGHAAGGPQDPVGAGVPGKGAGGRRPA